MPHKMLGYVFYAIACAMLMALLYNVLLVYDYDVVNTEVTVYDGKETTEVRSSYMLGSKGALWVAADNIQNACSFFFYENAFLPMVHQNDEIDQQLGVASDYFMMRSDGTVIEDSVASTTSGYKNTPADLESNNIYGVGSGWYHEQNY